MNWYGNTQTHEWGPTITSALSAAYSDALLRAHDLGLETDKSGRSASDTIAQYIVAGARRGQYDPKVLADGALRRLQR